MKLCKHSSDQDISATALEHYNPRGRGWLSARFDEFPHVLGFELQTPPPPPSSEGYREEDLANDVLNIHSLQVLSHETMISQQIEVFVGRDRRNDHDDGKGGRRRGGGGGGGGDIYYRENSFETAKFEYVGLLPFRHTTPQSSRELQTLSPLNIPNCQYLLLRVHGPHSHPNNIFGQVGIIAVSVSGTSSSYAKQLEETTPGYKQAAHIRRSERADMVKRSPRFVQELSSTLRSIELRSETGFAGSSGSSGSSSFSSKTGERTTTDSSGALSKTGTSGNGGGGGPSVSDLAFDMTYDGWTATLLKHVHEAMMYYVLTEKYEEADLLKDAGQMVRDKYGKLLTNLHQQRIVQLQQKRDYDAVESTDELLRRQRLFVMDELVDVVPFKK